MKTIKFKWGYRCEYKNLVTLGATRADARDQMLLILGFKNADR